MIPRPIYLVLLGVLVLLTFGRAMLQQYNFVWEDKAAITGNPAVIQGHIAQAAREAFWGPAKPWDRSGAYRPLTQLSYVVNARLTGPGPWGFHLVNLLLHYLCAVLLFFLARALLRDDAAAMVAALLFAAHPMVAGTVAWVSGRSELLLTALALGALLVHLRGSHARKPAGWSPMLAAALAFLAMLAGEAALSLVLIAPLLDAASPDHPRNFGQFVARNAGYWIAAGVYLSMRGHAHPYVMSLGLTPGPVVSFTLGQRLFLDVALAVLPVLSLVLVPVRLGGPEGTEFVRRADDPLVTLGLIAVVLLLAGSLWLYRRSRPAGASLTWFWVALLVPFLSITLAVRSVTDRSLYFPVAGLSLATAVLAMALWRWRPSALRAIEVALAVVILVHMGIAGARAELWRDERSYLRDVAAHNAGDARAWSDLGVAAHNLGDTKDAVAAFRKAREVDPLDPSAARNLGRSYLQAGQVDSALAVLQPAAQANPDRMELQLDLANALAARGQTRQAMFVYDQILRVDSTNVAAMVSLGQVLATEREFVAASRALERAHSLAPQDAAISNNLGLLYTVLHRGPQAEAAFREALAGDPSRPEFHYNLARLKYQQGDYEGALQQVNQLLVLLPGDPRPRALRDTLNARLAARGRAPGESRAR